MHENGAYGDKLLPETMGGGCALFDYDRDGDADILLVNSVRWPWDTRPAPRQPATLALYRNDGNWRFVDVTGEVGLEVTCYGMGVAVGDYDNDGDPDIFISTVGPNRLFRNDAGKFVEVTAEAGVAGADDQWSSGCSLDRLRQRREAGSVRLQLYSLVEGNRSGTGFLAGRDPRVPTARRWHFEGAFRLRLSQRR